MQNIRVRRHGENGTVVEPEDSSWRLVVEPGKDPKLWIAVECAANDEDDNPEAFERGDVEMIRGWMPAVYGDPELMEAIASDSMEAVVAAMGCPNAGTA
jgi:hypothetical protein